MSRASTSKTVEFQSESDFRDLVLRTFSELPGQQQLVADYLLKHPEEFAFLTVPTLARDSGVSEATIVRFAQRLGYDGFTDMKSALTRLVRGRVASQPSEDEGPSPSLDEGALRLVAHQEIANIRGLMKDVPRERFEEAAEHLFQADHVYTFGLGISAILAELAGYLLTQVGLRATVLSTKFSSPLEQLVALREKDALLVLSYPPFSMHTIDMMKEARRLGATTLAISDRLNAPVAEFSDYLFQIRSNNKMFTNSIGAVSVFLNALMTEVALKHGKQTTAAVSRINQILSTDKHLLIDG